MQFPSQTRIVSATVGAELAGWKERVCFHDDSSVPVGLVADLLQQSADGRITDGFGLMG